MTQAIEAEARALARHVVGAEPPEAVLARYREASARLFPEPPDAVDTALIAFAARHPWSVGPLDAATALLRPASRLRAQLLVMAAVLETTPRFADDFLPRPAGRLELVGRLGAIGLAAALRTLAGVLLYGVIRARA
jgi:hypothetical protein